MIRIPISVLSLTFALWCLETETAYGQSFRIVAETGDVAPGAGTFSQFVPTGMTPLAELLPAVSGDGTIGFTSAVSPQGVWVEEGTGIRSVANQFQDGAFVLRGVVSGPTNHFAFNSNVSQAWHDDGSAGQVVVNTATIAPGTVGSEFGLVGGLDGLSTRVGQFGEFGFFASLTIGVGDTTDTENDNGVWLFDGSTVSLALREGDPAPGFDPSAVDPCTPSLVQGSSDPRSPVTGVVDFAGPVRMAHANRFAVEGEVLCHLFGLDLFRDTIWVGGSSGLRVVAMAGIPVDGLPMVFFDDFAISEGGNAVAWVAAGVGTDGDFIAVDVGTGASVLAQQGDPIAGLAGITIGELRAGKVSVSDSGRVLFSASLANASANADTALLLASPGSGVQVIAREGDPAPGGGFFSAAPTLRFEINDLEQMLYSDGSTVWRGDGMGQTERLFGVGDMLSFSANDQRILVGFHIATGGGAGQAGLRTKSGGFGPSGEVAFLGMVGSEAIIGVDAIPVPEPRGGQLVSVVVVFWIAHRRTTRMPKA